MAGVALASLSSRIQELTPWLIVFGLVISLSFGLLCKLFCAPKKYVWIAFFIVIFLCGILRTQIRLNAVHRTGLENRANSTVRIIGTITGPLDLRQNGAKFTLHAEAEVLDMQSKKIRPIDTKLLISVPRNFPYLTGDRLLITGSLRVPKNFETDTGRTFHYDTYLLKDGITHQMSQPTVELIEEGRFSIPRTLFNVKRALIASASRFIPYPEAGLLSGILYGEKGGLSDNTMKDFRTTGIVHIVVLSGYNVTIIAIFMLRIFSRISRRFGFILGGIGIIAFAILTGGGTTIIRSSIMALLAVASQWYGREYDITRSLALAGFLMVLHNPLVLLFDISFQLSFLATIGLVYIGPMIEQYLAWAPEKFEIRGNLLATVSTQIFVLPLLMYATGQLSLISIIVNVLVLPLIPYAMFFGFFTAILGFFAGPVTWLAAFPTYGLLWLPLKAVELFARIPYAAITLPQLPTWSILVSYIFLFWIIIWWHSKRGDEKI